jgi:hypothetical protein
MIVAGISFVRRAKKIAQIVDLSNLSHLRAPRVSFRMVKCLMLRPVSVSSMLALLFLFFTVRYCTRYSLSKRLL